MNPIPRILEWPLFKGILRLALAITGLLFRTLHAMRPAVALMASLAGTTALLGYHPEASGWTRVVCPSGCEYSRIDTAITTSRHSGLATLSK